MHPPVSVPFDRTNRECPAPAAGTQTPEGSTGTLKSLRQDHPSIRASRRETIPGSKDRLEHAPARILYRESWRIRFPDSRDLPRQPKTPEPPARPLHPEPSQV